MAQSRGCHPKTAALRALSTVPCSKQGMAASINAHITLAMKIVQLYLLVCTLEPSTRSYCTDTTRDTHILHICRVMQGTDPHRPQPRLS